MNKQTIRHSESVSEHNGSNSKRAARLLPNLGDHVFPAEDCSRAVCAGLVNCADDPAERPVDCHVDHCECERVVEAVALEQPSIVVREPNGQCVPQKHAAERDDHAGAQRRVAHTSPDHCAERYTWMGGTNK